MHLTGCEVCWKCRGLVPGYSRKTSALKDHVLTCTGELNEDVFFNYIVCDKSDYFAMTQLKTNLCLHYKSLIEYAKNIPDELIRSIYKICNISVPRETFKDVNSTNEQTTSRQFLTDFVQQSVDMTSIQFVKKGSENSLTENGNSDKTKIDCTDSVHDPHQEFHCFGTSTDEINKNLTISGNSNGLLQEQIDQLRNECVIKTDGKLTTYCCKLCDKTHNSDFSMLKHLKIHNNGQAFECSNCKFSTIWRHKWNAHSNVCVHQTYICHICGLELNGKSNLMKHIGTCHSGNCTFTLYFEVKYVFSNLQNSNSAYCTHMSKS